MEVSLLRPGSLLRPLPGRTSLRLPCQLSASSRKQSALDVAQVGEDARQPIGGADRLLPGVASHAFEQLEPAESAASLADRRASQGSASTSDSPLEEDPPLIQPPIKQGRGRPKGPSKQQEKPATELIFKLERRGEGWGEEFVPHLTMEQRPLERSRRKGSGRRKLIKAASTASDDEEEENTTDDEAPDALELYLIELGVPPAEVPALVSTAVAWRVTPGGRPLIDRRRQSRLTRNVRIVAEHLEVECGVPFGPKGVGAVFLQVPELMLCKPTSNDRWDRRAVELAAFRLQHGHCNVPEVWEPNVELGMWVKRQRVARAAGQLSAERLLILERMGFEFGDLAQVTEAWEQRFDQLIDWILWHGENGQAFSWVGTDWGDRGGATARELALWMALQREFRRRQLLPTEATTRFDALNVEWEPSEEVGSEGVVWMAWLGRLLYVTERRCLAAARAPAAAAAAAVPFPLPANSFVKQRQETAAGDSDEEGSQPRRGGATRQKLAATIAARREALGVGRMAEDPGVTYWVARQRWLWRRGRLPEERVRMLHMAGVEMDVYTAQEWQEMAHHAAMTLRGAAIVLGLAPEIEIPPPQPLVVEAVAPPPQTPPVPPAAPQRGRPRRPPPPEPEPPAEPPAASKSPESEQQWRKPPGAGPVGSQVLRVRRWVLTQRSLFAAGRLSRAQLRYLTFLGIQWILSDAVMCMDDLDWEGCCAALAAASGKPWRHSQAATAAAAALSPAELAAAAADADSRVGQWLEHQRGLHALGLLDPRRAAALQKLPVSWRFGRSADAAAWDLRLSQLLAQSVAAGNLQVAPWNERFRGLAEWLEEQTEAAAAGQLSLCRVSQLKALGVVLPER